MGITKTPASATVLISNTVNYTIVVSNAAGGAAANGVTMVDTLPAGLQYVTPTGVLLLLSTAEPDRHVAAISYVMLRIMQCRCVP